MSIILASQSPRRRELLTRMGISTFVVLPAQAKEDMFQPLPPGLLVESLSRRKAEEVAVQAGPLDILIAADTVVVVEGTVLGKPDSREEAAHMLRRLSGREHMVCTGVTVRQGARVLTAHEATAVRFRPLTDGEILAYVATGEPMDKAGAYGIQGRGCMLVESITGSYDNVVGLPTCRLAQMLLELGLDIWAPHTPLM